MKIDDNKIQKRFKKVSYGLVIFGGIWLFGILGFSAYISRFKTIQREFILDVNAQTSIDLTVPKNPGLEINLEFDTLNAQDDLCDLSKSSTHDFIKSEYDFTLKTSSGKVVQNKIKQGEMNSWSKNSCAMSLGSIKNVEPGKYIAEFTVKSLPVTLVNRKAQISIGNDGDRLVFSMFLNLIAFAGAVIFVGLGTAVRFVIFLKSRKSG